MKRRAGIFLILLLTSVMAFAQGGGPPGACDYADADDPACLPLDTWVGVLAAIAVIATAVHLHRKKQREIMA